MVPATVIEPPPGQVTVARPPGAGVTVDPPGGGWAWAAARLAASAACSASIWRRQLRVVGPQRLRLGQLGVEPGLDLGGQGGLGIERGVQLGQRGVGLALALVGGRPGPPCWPARPRARRGPRPAARAAWCRRRPASHERVLDRGLGDGVDPEGVERVVDRRVDEGVDDHLVGGCVELGDLGLQVLDGGCGVGELGVGHGLGVLGAFTTTCWPATSVWMVAGGLDLGVLGLEHVDLGRHGVAPVAHLVALLLGRWLLRPRGGRGQRGGRHEDRGQPRLNPRRQPSGPMWLPKLRSPARPGWRECNEPGRLCHERNTSSASWASARVGAPRLVTGARPARLSPRLARDAAVHWPPWSTASGAWSCGADVEGPVLPGRGPAGRPEARDDLCCGSWARRTPARSTASAAPTRSRARWPWSPRRRRRRGRLLFLQVGGGRGRRHRPPELRQPAGRCRAVRRRAGPRPRPAGTEATGRHPHGQHGLVATATFPLAGRAPRLRRDAAISGVPGTAAAIRLDFEDIAGCRAAPCCRPATPSTRSRRPAHAGRQRDAGGGHAGRRRRRSPATSPAPSWRPTTSCDAASSGPATGRPADEPRRRRRRHRAQAHAGRTAAGGRRSLDPHVHPPPVPRRHRRARSGHRRDGARRAPRGAEIALGGAR